MSRGRRDTAALKRLNGVSAGDRDNLSQAFSYAPGVIGNIKSAPNPRELKKKHPSYASCLYHQAESSAALLLGLVPAQRHHRLITPSSRATQIPDLLPEYRSSTNTTTRSTRSPMPPTPYNHGDSPYAWMHTSRVVTRWNPHSGPLRYTGGGYAGLWMIGLSA
jgi:hypothetical protein